MFLEPQNQLELEEYSNLTNTNDTSLSLGTTEVASIEKWNGCTHTAKERIELEYKSLTWIDVLEKTYPNMTYPGKTLIMAETPKYTVWIIGNEQGVYTIKAPKETLTYDKERINNFCIQNTIGE